MSMTKSRGKLDEERWRTHRALNPPPPPDPHPVCSEIRRQVEDLTWNGGKVGAIWLGRKHFEQWLLERAEQTAGTLIPFDYYGAPVRRKACPGVTVLGELAGRWV